MHAFRISVSELGFSTLKPLGNFILTSASTSIKDAISEARNNKFTSAWWDTVTIVGVEYLGEIWYHGKERT